MAFIRFHSKEINTIIFDFDGTLAELTIDFQKMRRSIADLIVRYGLADKYLDHRFALEMIEEAGTVLEKQSSCKADTFRQEAFRIIQNIELDAARQGALFAGTKDLFSNLRKHSIAAGIITRNCSEAVKTIFPDISDYCQVVICRDHVRQVKPHPEQINLAIARLGGSATNSMMVGDHPLDIQTGKNAGTFSAGVLSGHFHKQDFLDAGADLVLRQAPDILELI
ncbi:MAG TPA: HAD family hydrolase [Smithellaceae bacterium]|nr:HAD family hydrolase [Smithellaceae bacterium]HQM46125.1 HAD family hydrolase [Smithellaceae bacterium]